MHKINGFSNEFYGWGGEDDDIFHRIQDAKINVHREPANIARFTMLLHGKVRFGNYQNQKLIWGPKNI